MAELPRAPVRRRLLRVAAVLAGAPLAGAGCGFQLRGATELPFKTFFSSVPQASQFGGELRRALRTNGATIVERREDVGRGRRCVAERGRRGHWLRARRRGGGARRPGARGPAQATLSAHLDAGFHVRECSARSLRVGKGPAAALRVLCCFTGKFVFLKWK